MTIAQVVHTTMTSSAQIQLTSAATTQSSATALDFDQQWPFSQTASNTSPSDAAMPTDYGPNVSENPLSVLSGLEQYERADTATCPLADLAQFSIQTPASSASSTAPMYTNGPTASTNTDCTTTSSGQLQAALASINGEVSSDMTEVPHVPLVQTVKKEPVSSPNYGVIENSIVNQSNSSDTSPVASATTSARLKTKLRTKQDTSKRKSVIRKRAKRKFATGTHISKNAVTRSHASNDVTTRSHSNDSENVIDLDAELANAAKDAKYWITKGRIVCMSAKTKDDNILQNFHVDVKQLIDMFVLTVQTTCEKYELQVNELFRPATRNNSTQPLNAIDTVKTIDDVKSEVFDDEVSGGEETDEYDVTAYNVKLETNKRKYSQESDDEEDVDTDDVNDDVIDEYVPHLKVRKTSPKKHAVEQNLELGAHNEQEHTITNETTKKLRWRCKKCPQAFKTRRLLYDHRRTHTTRKKKKSERKTKTPRVVVDKNSTNEMIEQKLRERENLPSDVSYEVPLLQCGYCDKTFASSGNLRHHVRVHVLSLCKICNKTFPSIGDLTEHRATAHPKQKVKDSRARVIHVKQEATETASVPEFTENDAEFGSVPMATESAASDVGDKKAAKKGVKALRYECVICNKVFTAASYLSRHIKRAHDQPFKCAQCKKCFGFIHVLLVHVRRHTGERPYTCSVCPQAFRTKPVLDYHMAAHEV